MATPMQFLPITGLNAPSTHPSTPTLEDAFLQTIVLLSRLPFRRAGETRTKGLVRDEGLTAATLRAVAIAWCRSKTQRARFGADELRALELALHDFSDAELKGLVKGAFAIKGLKVQ